MSPCAELKLIITTAGIRHPFFFLRTDRFVRRRSVNPFPGFVFLSPRATHPISVFSAFPNLFARTTTKLRAEIGEKYPRRKDGEHGKTYRRKRGSEGGKRRKR